MDEPTAYDSVEHPDNVAWRERMTQMAFDLGAISARLDRLEKLCQPTDPTTEESGASADIDSSTTSAAPSMEEPPAPVNDPKVATIAAHATTTAPPSPLLDLIARVMARCQRCDGCGQIADSDSGEPWTAWAELPPGADLAVRLGIVKPMPCPVCSGTGATP